MRRCLVWCILSPLVAWYERKHIRDIKDLKGTPLRSIWTNSLLTSDFVTKLCESFGPFEFQCTGTTCKVYMVYGSFTSASRVFCAFSMNSLIFKGGDRLRMRWNCPCKFRNATVLSLEKRFTVNLCLLRFHSNPSAWCWGYLQRFGDPSIIFKLHWRPQRGGGRTSEVGERFEEEEGRQNIEWMI